MIEQKFELQKLLEIAKEDLEDPVSGISDIMLYQKDDNVIGIIYCTSSMEENDNHCEQCKNELLCFKFREPELPEGFLSSMVGPTKFERIRSGYRAFEGLDLTNATIFDMNLNVLEVKQLNFQPTELQSSIDNSSKCNCDNPEWDSTDFAHPAWWRGCDHGVEMTADAINKVLDSLESGKKDTFNFGSDKLTKLSERLRGLLKTST